MIARIERALALLATFCGTFFCPQIVQAQRVPVIIEAVEGGRVNDVRRLLDDGVDLNVRHGDGASALHWAAHRDDLDIAVLLIDSGATIDAVNDLGATPLWLAAVNGSNAMVARLLDAGANPNLALRMGETPLMTAARGGSVKVVELLLSHGADVNAVEHERRQTAIMWAVGQQHSEVVRVLLAHGANIQARTLVWDQLENTAGNTNTSGNFRMVHGGSTPLLLAASRGNLETARALVEAGANVNDTAAAGTSALVIATHSGHGLLATYLLEQGADPNAAEAGYTALQAAVLRSEVDLVDALLQHGADPNAILEHGTPGRRFSSDYSLRHQLIGVNALWLAAKFGELEILRTLARHGADPFVSPENGMSALQAAMGVRGDTENRRNQRGLPSLSRDDEEQLTLELARITLDLGVNVNAADQQGNTALHYAVRRDFESVVEFLANQGADLNVRNDRDETPLTLAEELSESAQATPNGSETAARPSISELLRRLGTNSR